MVWTRQTEHGEQAPHERRHPTGVRSAVTRTNRLSVALQRRRHTGIVIEASAACRDQVCKHIPTVLQRVDALQRLLETVQRLLETLQRLLETLQRLRSGVLAEPWGRGRLAEELSTAERTKLRQFGVNGSKIRVVDHDRPHGHGDHG